MKITNIRSEDLVGRIINNGLTEDDEKYIETFKPKKYKHNPSPETVKKQTNGEDINTAQMKNTD